MSSLPIESSLPNVVAALNESNTLVLHAPPGAGKTTRVPLYLLQEAGDWLAGQKILMLEPRRLAARAAAYRMSECLGEEVGLTVGYRTRLDSKVSADTRIEVVTEGILTRMLQQDPELRGVACIIFDEFHERSLSADLGLSLSLDIQSSLREELRIVVMSATLDVEQLLVVLEDVPVVRCMGKSYPVDVHYLGGCSERDLVSKVVLAIQQALHLEGSVLVFLPGEGEIRQVARALSNASLGDDVWVVALYGALSRDEQNEAIRPCRQGRRKLVLATPIAETSLTIDGVRIVIDSGRVRVSRFEHQVGMNRLHTVRVSQASAKQRCGRAGRTEPGVCFRLWTEEQHKGMVKFHSPEILSADLAAFALELAQWGVACLDDLTWIDSPPLASYEQARKLLVQLGALNSQYRITAHGREMLSLALHPRLAHMVIKAKSFGLGAMACDIAAILEERDLLKSRGGDAGADLQLRLMAVYGELAEKGWVDDGVLKRVKQTAAQLRKKLAVKPEQRDLKKCGHVLALAYPDRIAQKRKAGEGQFLLSSGKGASMDTLDPLSQEEYLVAAKLGGQGQSPRIYLAAAITKEELLSGCSMLISKVEVCIWDELKLSVFSKVETRLGALVLQEQRLSSVPDKERAQTLLLEAIRRSKLSLLDFPQGYEQWLARVSFAESLIKEERIAAPNSDTWPSVSKGALIETLPQWLGPYLDGVCNADQLKRLDIKRILSHVLSWEQQQWLHEMLPEKYQVPTGSYVTIDYDVEDGPVLAVRLQEMFGVAQTPTVAQGAVPLKLHLLSPARRPIQITRDLAGFWQGSYAEVKKEMKGRYPKHVWPDDPLHAEATKYTKHRRQP